MLKVSLDVNTYDVTIDQDGIVTYRKLEDSASLYRTTYNGAYGHRDYMVDLQSLIGRQDVKPDVIVLVDAHPVTAWRKEFKFKGEFLFGNELSYSYVHRKGTEILHVNNTGLKVKSHKYTERDGVLGTEVELENGEVRFLPFE